MIIWPRKTGPKEWSQQQVCARRALMHYLLLFFFRSSTAPGSAFGQGAAAALRPLCTEDAERLKLNVKQIEFGDSCCSENSAF
jgi:hypothetical protein